MTLFEAELRNKLVVIQVMDRLLYTAVLHALYLEWGNPRCCVPMPRALTGDCIFRSIRNNPQGDDEKDEKYWNRHQQEKMHSMHNG